VWVAYYVWWNNLMHQHSLICYSPKMWSNLYWRGFIRHPPKDSQTWITPESHKLLDMYKSCWFLLASFVLQSISMHWFSPLFIAHFSYCFCNNSRGMGDFLKGNIIRRRKALPTPCCETSFDWNCWNLLFSCISLVTTQYHAECVYFANWIQIMVWVMKVNCQYTDT
jgi:hypothetical protein